MSTEWKLSESLVKFSLPLSPPHHLIPEYLNISGAIRGFFCSSWYGDVCLFDDGLMYRHRMTKQLRKLHDLSERGTEHGMLSVETVKLTQRMSHEF